MESPSDKWFCNSLFLPHFRPVAVFDFYGKCVVVVRNGEISMSTRRPPSDCHSVDSSSGINYIKSRLTTSLGGRCMN